MRMPIAAEAPLRGVAAVSFSLGNLGKEMVGVAGFEPATPASRTQCSTRLSHTPTWRAAYRHASAVSQATKIAPQKEKRREKRSSKQRCIRPTPALSPPPRRALRGSAVPAGEWCNGNTAVFGTVILGSSPSSPATSFSSRSALSRRRPRATRPRACPGIAVFHRKWSSCLTPGKRPPAHAPTMASCGLWSEVLAAQKGGAWPSKARSASVITHRRASRPRTGKSLCFKGKARLR
jgi:hypothetical protein